MRVLHIVPTAWGMKPYQRPVGDVIADIRQTGAKRLLFLDLNLISDRDYARELFTALVPLKVKWAGLATTNITRDPNLLDLAARSGYGGLRLGFESPSPEIRELMVSGRYQEIGPCRNCSLWHEANWF